MLVIISSIIYNHGNNSSHKAFSVISIKLRASFLTDRLELWSVSLSDMQKQNRPIQLDGPRDGLRVSHLLLNDADKSNLARYVLIFNIQCRAIIHNGILSLIVIASSWTMTVISQLLAELPKRSDSRSAVMWFMPSQ